MSTLAGLPVLRAEVMVPAAGAWWGVFVLDATVLPNVGRARFVLHDLELEGGIIRRDWDDHPGGGRVVAVARGGPGWDNEVTRKGLYEGDNVKLSTVLRDLAGMAGEAYSAPPDVALGSALAWQASSATAPVCCVDVLHELIARGFLATWRVEPFSGQTVFAPWPSLGAADARGRVVARAGHRGRRTVGLDTMIAAFLPGAVLEGVPIVRTVYKVTAREVRADVYNVVTDAAVSAATTSAAATIGSITTVGSIGGGAG